jgi:hypothetical protein
VIKQSIIKYVIFFLNKTMIKCNLKVNIDNNLRNKECYLIRSYEKA